MKKTVEDIIKEVKICIDEIALNDADFLNDQDNQEMDTIIRSKIIDALRYVNGNADWSFLVPDETIGEGFIGENLVGKVVLPDNFMRLCYARFQSWSIFISEPIYWNDKEYATLSDQYATGTWERPKLAMVLHPKRTLELYKAKDENDKIEVGFMIEPKIIKDESGDYINIGDKLDSALIYYISGLTLLTYKDNHAEAMFNQAMVLMGIQTTSE